MRSSKDLGLRQRPLDARRDDDFAHLALVGDVVADQQVLHHLLGDGRAALRPARAREIRHHGADEAALVDALVLVEALVLGGDECLLDVERDIPERHPDTAVALGEIGETLALGIEHAAGAGQARALEAAVVGQVGDRAVIEPDHLADIDRRILQVLVLAELAIHRDEAVELQPVERLDLARDRVRIVHRGLDQVIEVERLDIERLAHMGAAVAHDLGDFGLVAHGVELRLDRVRPCRHLAEREERRQNLDEDHVHEDGGSVYSPNSSRPLGIPHSHDGFFRVDIRARSPSRDPSPSLLTCQFRSFS
jgi:hypothetical protein